MAEQVNLEERLAQLEAKQALVEEAWRKTGNRELLQFFVDVMPSAVDAERCSVFVHDPNQDNVWLECGTGLKEMQVKVPTRGSLVGEAVLTGEAQFRNDMEGRAGPHNWVDMQTGFVTRNALAVPIRGISSQKVVGAIQVLNKRRGSGFTEADRLLLERLANHLQMNIENIYLRQELARLLLEMGKTIGALKRRLGEGGR